MRLRHSCRGARAMGAASLVALLSVFPGCIARHVEMWSEVDRAVAMLRPTQGHEVRGTIWFTQLEDGVRVTGQISGLGPNSTHAIHIHEFGDATSPDGSSAGDHYNPREAPHGLPPEQPRHAGDLGNLIADGSGAARLDIVVAQLSVAEMTNPVIGRAVVIHSRMDSGAQPAGDSGDRLAVGAIGVARSVEPPTVAGAGQE